MKKLSKILALGLATALTFGMTVCAAESPNPDASTESNAQVENITGITAASGKEVTWTALDAKDYADAASIVAEVAKDDEIESATIVAAADVTVEGAGEVTFAVKGATTDKVYIALHFNGTKWEALDAVVSKEGFVTVNFSSLSPVVIVEVLEKDGDDDSDDDDDDDDDTVVSPKTGEVLPVAGVMAVICLAGAALCTKKAQN